MNEVRVTPRLVGRVVTIVACGTLAGFFIALVFSVSFQSTFEKLVGDRARARLEGVPVVADLHVLYSTMILTGPLSAYCTAWGVILWPAT